MPGTDFQVAPDDVAADTSRNFSSSSAPGEPAASCPLAAAAAEPGSDSKFEAKASVAADDESKSGLKPDAGAEYKWVDTEGAARQFGDDKNNFQLGAYNASLSSGISKVDGGVKADLISGSASYSAAKASGEKDFFDGVASVKGDAEVLNANATAEAGAELSDTKKAIEAKVGGEANLAKASAGGEIKIPIPFTDHVLTLGANVEGQIGASAEASAGGGWSKEDGYYLEAKAKAALGLGGGVGFSLGFK